MLIGDKLSRLARKYADSRIGRAAKGIRDRSQIQRYLDGGRIPWSPGYSKYKNQLLSRTFEDHALMARFSADDLLPEGHGPRLDERVVELPWTLAHIRKGDGLILDAGSVLNHPMILGEPGLRNRRLIIHSLDMDWIRLDPNVSYLFGDFRDRLFRDELFETIVCISTLEHVGMWPIPKPPFKESLAKPQPPVERTAYREVLRTFHRWLKPGGQLLLTLPYGRFEDHEWLQQFDADGIRDVIASFGGDCRTETYYRHHPEGWQKASAEECSECSYHNLVRRSDFDPDYAAAARAVACLELVRGGVD